MAETLSGEADALDLLERMLQLKANARLDPEPLEQVLVQTLQSEVEEARALEGRRDAERALDDEPLDFLRPDASTPTLDLVEALASMPRAGWAHGKSAGDTAWRALREFDYLPCDDEDRKRPTRLRVALDRRRDKARAKVATDVRNYLRRVTDELSLIVSSAEARAALGADALAAIERAADANRCLFKHAPEPGEVALGGRPVALAPLRSAIKAGRVSQRTIARAVLASDRDWKVPPCRNAVAWVEGSIRSHEDGIALLERRISEWLR